MSFQYPKHANSDRPHPFVGPDGANPFSDRAVDAAEETPGDAAPITGITHHPNDIVQTYAHRGPKLFVGGLLGMLSSLLGAAGVGISQMWGAFADATSAGCAAALLLGVIGAWSAWIMGRNDLQAMAHGAMDRRGRTATRFGCWFGMLGTFVAAAAMLGMLLSFLQG